MNEPTAGLDIVREIHALIKTVRDSSIAETFGPIVPPLAELLQRENKSSVERDAKDKIVPVPPVRVNVWALKEYLELCKDLGLDAKDPGTPKILRGLQDKIA